MPCVRRYALGVKGPLKGCLHRRSSEDGEIDRLLEDVARLEALVVDPRIFDRNLSARIFDGLYNVLEQHDADVSLPVIDVE